MFSLSLKKKIQPLRTRQIGSSFLSPPIARISQPAGLQDRRLRNGSSGSRMWDENLQAAGPGVGVSVSRGSTTQCSSVLRKLPHRLLITPTGGGGGSGRLCVCGGGGGTSSGFYQTRHATSVCLTACLVYSNRGVATNRKCRGAATSLTCRSHVARASL